MDVVLNCISKFVSSFIMMSVVIYEWHRLLNKKFNFKNSKNLITIIILSFVSIANYYIVNSYIRIFLITLILMIMFWYLFRENIHRCIITPIISQLVVMISEMIFVVLVCVIFNMNNDGIIDTQFGHFFSNIFISLIMFLIFKIPIIEKFYNILIRATEKIKRNQLLVITLILMLIANILTMFLYYRIEFRYLLIFSTALTLFCFVIVLNMFKSKGDYIKVYDKYNTTLKSLKEYEDILDKYRVSNHENKNQLLTIRNMISKTDKKTISYIDTIIENKLKDNDKAMFEVSKIPVGGLRGLIYSKILTMKSEEISYELEISNSIKTIDLINLDDSLMLDICQIIGVYIDNAIQAVQNLKEKYINIEMYLDNEFLVISVINNYSGKIEIDKLENKGYTSKGEGHGYGLSLTKEIIDKNKNLYNEKRINKDSFSQTLKVKVSHDLVAE